jgi:hypothetical protein
MERSGNIAGGEWVGRDRVVDRKGEDSRQEGGG